MENPIISLPDNKNAKTVFDYLSDNAIKRAKEVDGTTLPVGLVQIVIGRLAKQMKVGRPTIQYWLDSFLSAKIIIRPDERLQKFLAMRYAPANSNWFIVNTTKSYDEICTKRKANKMQGASTLPDEASALLAIVQTYVKSALSATYYAMQAASSKPSASSCACILSPCIESLLSISKLLLCNSSLYAATDSSANSATNANSGIDANSGYKDDNDFYAAFGISDAADIDAAAATSDASGLGATAATDASSGLSATAATGDTAATNAVSGLDATAANGIMLTSVPQMANYVAAWLRELYQESKCNTPGERSHAHTRETETEIPSLRQVLNFASKRDISEQSAKAFYDHFSQTGWKTTQGNHLYDWRARLMTWANSDNEYKQNLFRNEKRVEKIRNDAMNLKRDVLQAVAEGRLSPDDGVDAIMLGLNGQKPDF